MVIKKRKQSSLEKLMESQMLGAGIPEWETEVKFYRGRDWRFDFAWPDRNVALEVEGGTHAGGRHTTGTGFEADCEKYNVAVILGWSVIRVTRAQIESGAALVWIESVLRSKK